MRTAGGVVRAARNPDPLANAVLESHVGGPKNIAELLLLALALDDRDGPLPTSLGRGGLGGLAIRVDRNRKVHRAQQSGCSHSHHARAENRNMIVSGSNQMLLDDVAHFGGATPTQRDAGTAVPVIVHNELTGDRLRIESIGAVAIGTDTGNACSLYIGIESKIRRR